jgi:beta-N-acetylhexosaminidase
MLERLAAGSLLASFPGPDAPRWILDLLADGGLAGVVLFGSNVGSLDDVASLTRRLHAVRPDAVVGIDEEGGDVTRLEADLGSSFPGNAALGAVDDVGLTFDVAAAIGRLLCEVGIDLDLAPCLDVNSDPRNPVIGVRSFGADPLLVARHGAAFVRGLQSTGVAACAKHFPGHGHTSVDSHLSLPVVDADRDLLDRRELVPFVAAVAAEVAAIMSAHLVVPSLDDRPATLSHAVLTGLLRESLGFGGVVVTDALDMAGVSASRGVPRAAVEALAAGADLCCLGPVPDEDAVAAVIRAVVGAVETGELSEERLHEAAARTAAIRPATTPTVAERWSSPGDVDRPAMRVATTGGRPDRASGRSSLGRADRPESVRRSVDDIGDVGLLAAWRALRPLRPIATPLTGAHVIELVPASNIAVGDVPWGLAGPMRRLDPSVTSERLGAGERPATAVPADRPVVLVTRDGHRHAWQRDLLALLDDARPDAVVVIVEMGWPARPDDHTGPDALLAHADAAVAGAGLSPSDASHAGPAFAPHLLTYGASRVSALAAAHLLLGKVPGHG